MGKTVTTSDIFFRFQNWFVEISAIDSLAFWVLIQLIVVTWLEKVTITKKLWKPWQAPDFACVF
jgi:hypothetical protein